MDVETMVMPGKGLQNRQIGSVTADRKLIEKV